MTVTGRLPGTYFQVDPTPPAETLPRMDIAAFVGFAASGPLHIPVPIEDVARFRDIFGADLPLAWDATTGKMQRAYLGPTVEAFFRNGGRRCWVVRVAGEAEVNLFSLPGLVRAGDWHPAVARARSAGSWSDTPRIGTVRLGQTIGVAKGNLSPEADFQGTPGSYQLGLLAGPSQVGAGDLLQLSFGIHGPLLFLVVDGVTPAQDRQTIACRQGYWFLCHRDASIPRTKDDVSQVQLTGQPEAILSLHRLELPAEPGGRYEVQFEQESGRPPRPGDLLCLDFVDGEQLLLPIASITQMATKDSPPLHTWHVISQVGLWPISEEEGLSQVGLWPDADGEGSPPAAKPALSVERVTFDLLLWHGQEIQARLRDLAFTADHPRAWTSLPTDDDLFRPVNGRPISITRGTLVADAANPRFPLAGPEKPLDSNAPYLPLGMLPSPDLGTAHGPLVEADTATALQRNGLRQFSADLFLDADLGEIGYGALFAEANYKRYLRGGQGEPLHGLHSLLSLDEVTIIAVPDAVQRGWERSLPPPLEILLPTTLELERPPDETERYILRWQPVDGAKTYLLQEATEPAFSHPVNCYEGPDVERAILYQGDMPQTYFYRVRARCKDRIGPWSNTESITAPQPDFESCQRQTLDAPRLTLTIPTSPPEQGVLLVWTSVVGAETYSLQEATDPAFHTANTIYSGPNTAAEISRHRSSVYYYRVHAQDHGTVSPWSNSRVFVVRPGEALEMTPPKDYQNGDLLAIHRALVRFCAARGDVLAVMALPAHYREDQTLAHVTALMPHTGQGLGERTGSGELQVPPLTPGEDYALSFGALYLPWAVLQVEDGLRLTPPDGVVGGAIASGAIAAGAWIAPANAPLRGVVSLEPSVDGKGWSRFYANQINVMRPHPRGFLFLSADTLSIQADVRPINVRRFLILLRRLALREGAKFVFEPNDQAFRDMVQFKFEQLLTDLYRRGALAGRTPATAFRVVTDDAVNTPASIEQGRFIVELRVAPSKPLAFITVRLVQHSSEGLAIQEI